MQKGNFHLITEAVAYISADFCWAFIYVDGQLENWSQ